MVILGLTLNKVFYKKRGSEHFYCYTSSRPERMEAPSPHAPRKDGSSQSPHALKGQKLLAQGIALGMMYASLSP